MFTTLCTVNIKELLAGPYARLALSACAQTSIALPLFDLLATAYRLKGLIPIGDCARSMQTFFGPVDGIRTPLSNLTWSISKSFPRATSVLDLQTRLRSPVLA